MKKVKFRAYQFGIIAEFIAIIFLTFKGYKIIKRRYKTFVGEVDIIAKKSDYLIAVEVKARKRVEVVDEVLSINQKQRIKRAMEVFLASSRKYKNCGVRFDLIIVLPKKLPQHFLGFWE